MPVEISLLAEKVQNTAKDDTDDTSFSHQIVSPGDVITRDAGYMRGHGTHAKNDVLQASVAGVVQRVNKLISVIPPKTKYQGEIGDVVVGRITEVQQKRWKVDINCRLDGVLQLSAVNLPGGEHRRRSAEDELSMRTYLQEGDLISAEVQNIYSDGAVSLHTRSLKYGKLSQGTLLRVSPSLIKRRKTHFHKMAFGVSVILGNNGYVWISPTSHDNNEEVGGGGFAQNMEVVTRSDRLCVSRLRNCISAIAAHGVMLWDTSIIYAYEISLAKFHPGEILRPEVMSEIASLTKERIKVEAMEQ